jgi:uncharacterized DUF497 family protein
MYMGPKFDPDKDAANIVKHGLSLVEGEGVLNDPLGLTVEDDSFCRRVSLDHSRDERRRRNIGGCLDGVRRRRTLNLGATSNSEGAKRL